MFELRSFIQKYFPKIYHVPSYIQFQLYIQIVVLFPFYNVYKQ